MSSFHDEDGVPTFAFHDLDYIPHGTSGILAPYIETTAGTMRAAATLMSLDLGTDVEASLLHKEGTQTVVCDLGCGDGDFRTNECVFYCQFLHVSQTLRHEDLVPLDNLLSRKYDIDFHRLTTKRSSHRPAKTRQCQKRKPNHRYRCRL